MKKIVILGSTGSIGTQTLDVIRKNKRDFKIIGLTCNSNIKILKEQIKEFKPLAINVPKKFNEEFKNLKIRIFNDEEGLCHIAALKDADLVVNAIVGSAGVEPTISAIQAKKDIAIANKEALVCEGKKIMKLVKKNRINLIPIDSEHNAIFQCLEGRDIKEVEKIVLTCSGGPFRGFNKNDLEKVTLKDAIKHPTWKMGAKISIDSATLVNKGLEVIEAMHLFNLKLKQIEVVIHPQSQIHGIVYFKDGSVLMHAASADMRIPIFYSLYYPEKKENSFVRLDIGSRNLKDNSQTAFLKWDFEKVDLKTFEGLKLAYEAAKKGMNYPKKFNEANEKAVKLFLEGKIRFLDIYKLLKKAIK